MKQLYIILVEVYLTCVSYATNDVIVIGAGASGLAAARELTNQGGFTVTVLEARANRYGGRIWTNAESFTHTSGPGVDMGASFIHHGDDSNSVMKLLKEFHLPLFDSEVEESVFVVRQKDNIPYEDSEILSASNKVTEALKAAENYCKSHNVNISVKEALLKTGHNTQINDSLSQVFISVQEFCVGSSIDDASARLFNVGYENASAITDKIPELGYKQLLDKMVQRNSTDVPLDIRLGQEVTQIEVLANQRVAVTCAGGTMYECDAVIITLPLGVLKAQTVKFIPPLPKRKTEAIQRLGFGTANKIVLEFDRIFWPREKTRMTVAVDNATNRGELTIFEDFRPFSNLPILISYAIGLFGVESENFSDKQLQDLALIRLRTLFGPIMDTVTVVRMSRTRWLADPFSRGSYSYPALDTLADDWDRVGEASPPLFFAGEHTQTVEYGTVHTAIDTGRRAAKETMAFLGDRPTENILSISPTNCLIALSVMYLARRFLL